jgi:hypothetical protein
MTAVPMVVPVVSPADLFRPEILNLCLARDGGMNILDSGQRPCIYAERTRRQRRGLRAHGQRGGPGGNSNGKLQKVAAFHDFSVLVSGE